MSDLNSPVGGLILVGSFYRQARKRNYSVLRLVGGWPPFANAYRFCEIYRLG